MNRQNRQLVKKAKWLFAVFALFAVVLCATSASAATRTYKGTDGDWTNDANWEGGVPGANDIAEFTSTCTISSSFALPGWTGVSVASGKTVTFTGNISGNGAFVSTGAGNIILKGENSFTGDLIQSNGCVYARSAKALGSDDSGKVYAYMTSTTVGFFFGGVDTRRNIESCNRKPDGGDMTRGDRLMIEANTTNHFRGHWKKTGSYLRASIGANAKAVFYNGVTWSASSLFWNRLAGSETIFTNTPVSIMYQYNCDAGDGVMVFACEGNTITDKTSSSQNVRGALRTDVNNALTAQSVVNQGKFTFNLNGTTQTISRIYGRSLSDTGVLTSARDGLMTCTAVGYTNTCAVTGQASLTLSGTAGNVYLSGKSTSSGTLTVGGGKTVYMINSSKWNGAVDVEDGGVLDASNGGLFGNVKVRSGGTLTAGVASIGENVELELESGAVLNLPAGGYPVAKFVGPSGTALPPGFYGANASVGVTAVEEIVGDGLIYVVPSGTDGGTFTWVGGSSGSFNSAANWRNEEDEEELPDFSSGADTLVFPAAGLDLTVDVDAVVKGMSFTGDEAGTVSFRPSEAGRSLCFKDGLLDVSMGSGGAKTIRLDLPVRVLGNMYINLPGTASTKNYLVMTSGLFTVSSLYSGCAIGKDGLGDWLIGGDANAIFADVMVSNGYTYVSGADPLGGAGTFYQQPTNGNTKLVLNDAIVTRDVSTKNPNDKCGGTVISSANTTNVITGRLINRTHHCRVYPGVNSMITLAGGMTLSSFLLAYGTANTCYTCISNVPVQSSSQLYQDQNNKSTLVLAVAGNKFSEWNIYNRIRTDVDWAIYTNTAQSIHFNSRNTSMFGELDLNGTRQHVKDLYRTFVTNAAGVVTRISAGTVSGGPGSELSFVGASDNWPFGPCFVDAASVVRSGGGTTHIIDACSSTGSVTVTGGRLVFEKGGEWSLNGVAQPVGYYAGGSWAGKSVTVTGGTLVINTADTFPRHSEFSIGAESGVIEIADGVEQKCSFLYIDGVKQRLGRYGNSGVTQGRIVGGGVLNCIGDGTGTMMIFR
jgi:hypothetical protein